MQTIAFQKIYDFYKNLYGNMRSINKLDRYTWGEKCDHLAMEILSLSARADYLPRMQKLPAVQELSSKIDLLKIFLRLGHELKIIDQKKYIVREKELMEIGKIIGGWLKTLC